MATVGNAGADSSRVADIGSNGLRRAPSQPAEPRVIADGLVGPLSIDHSWRSTLVAQAFAGVVSRVDSDGDVKDLIHEEGVTSVAAGPFGTIIYGVRTGPEGQFSTSLLKVRMPWGTTRVLADIGAYEKEFNPDSVNAYGIQGLSPECEAQWPAEQMGPVSYKGERDSNPYKLTMTWFGVYVADAGANAILFVDWAGRVSTVAVLPPQTITIPDDPTAMGLPSCVGGKTYGFEPVPTDIEFSRRDAYVSLLPGGPEDESLGARGSVVRLNMRSGRSHVIASGLAGATDLAVSPFGDVYVTQFFGNQISKVTRRGLSTVAELPSPAAIEWSWGRLIVAYDAMGSGKLASLRL